jgi:integrase
MSEKKRGRPRTGSVRRHEDHFDVRITFPNGDRGSPRCLPAGTSEAYAREIARAMTERAIEMAKEEAKADATAGVASPAPALAHEAWEAWAARWFDARDGAKPGSAKENRGHFKKWVPPELKTNPCEGIAGPDRGEKKGKVYLFPAEFLAMACCTRIPIRWKRLFALVIYLYPRPGELEVLHVDDVNLEHRFVYFHRAIARDGKSEKGTKTGYARRVPIEPPLVPLLERMIAEAREEGRELLVIMPPESDLSQRLRQYIEWAGLDRPELLTNDKTRKWMTFYDLRATGLTWLALRGDEPLKIQQRAGHRHFSTTQGYIRAAEELAHALGASDVFPVLPEAVLTAEIASEGPAAWAKLRGSQWKPGQTKVAPVASAFSAGISAEAPPPWGNLAESRNKEERPQGGSERC